MVSSALVERASTWARNAVRLAVVVTLLALSAVPAAAQVDITVHPAMTKGPAQAAVTILEFSDYQ